MARQFTRSRGRLGSKRATLWADIGLSRTAIATGGSVLNSAGASLLAKRPFTIVRVHLEVLMESDQVIASEGQVGAIGMCVVSDQAAAVGVTAVPTPATDAGSDLWFLHRFMFGSFVFGTASGFQDPAGVSASIDSKAMRKVNDDQDVLVVAQQASALSDGFTMLVGGRILIKEN